MDKLDWTKIADTLKSVFKTMLCCDIKRTQKTRDALGGDIECSVIMYVDVPCYMSKHPKGNYSITENSIGVAKNGTYTIHFHPDVDVRDGDIICVKGKSGDIRQFLVTRVAEYHGHTRVETSVWDKLE